MVFSGLAEHLRYFVQSRFDTHHVFLFKVGQSGFAKASVFVSAKSIPIANSGLILLKQFYCLLHRQSIQL